MSRPPPQSLVTVCVPVREDRRFQAVTDSEVNALLERYGNPCGAPVDPHGRDAHPAGARLAEAVAALGIIHFFSLTLIPAQARGESSMLVLEISGDGSEADVLKHFAHAAAPHLLPVFERACGIRSPRALERELKRRRRRLSQWIPGMTLLPGRSIGAGFVGAPGLTLAQIRNDAAIAELAEAVIKRLARDARPEPSLGPLPWRETVLAHLRGEDPLGLAGTPPDPGDTDDALLRDEARRKAIARELWDGDSGAAPVLADTPAIAPGSSLGALLVRLLSLPVIVLIVCLFASSVALGGALTTSGFGTALLTVFSEGLSAGWLRQMAIALLTGTFIFALLAAGLGGLALVALRRSERRNRPVMPDLDPARLSEILIRENRTPAQNHMVSVTEVIGEPYRKFVTLPAAFSAVAQAVKKGLFAPGHLADIGTIHFARWIVLPRSNRLVFFSNYDGNWESYLEDFISKASTGLTGVWSNCRGFPATRYLFQDGARDGDRFKRWARQSMLPTRLWYSAYPDLSMARIRRAARIRDGVVNARSRADAQTWLDQFDSAPRPDDSLETSDMQSLLLTGMRKHLHSAGLVVRFPDTASERACRAWVADIEREVSTGRSGLGASVVNVAFTASGLARLGLAGEVATEPPSGLAPPPGEPRFAAAFALGMDSPTRRRMLGDTGENAPDAWDWGQREHCHALLMLYARPAEGEGMAEDAHLQALMAHQTALIQRHGLEIATTIAMKPFPPGRTAIRDPFGYVDGISQPRIRGLVKRAESEDARHLVEAGEFILGYRDNRGYFPPSLLVDARKDAADILAEPAGETGAGRLKDFGRNGSFLVVRHLEQDVRGFHDWVHTQANQLRLDENCHLTDVSDEWVYAKIMGRWRSGHPLVRYPDGGAPVPSKEDRMALEEANLENAFEYGDLDPQGHRCPFGAHIRRANPRDSLNPDNPLTLSISNRHRILRRGRFFETPQADNRPASQGTFFMCLNGDIERQFEFIQQNWMNAASFHGLSGEIDPVSGLHASEDGSPCPYSTYTLPSEHGPDQLTNWQSFVRLRGGGYFFLPGRRALRFLAGQELRAHPESRAHRQPASSRD